jgi:hypothetical protein
MQKVINLIMPGGAGGTFFDWTIHYLTSPTLTRSYVSRDFNIHNDISVVHNPLTHNNAHRHYRTDLGTGNFDRVMQLYYLNNRRDIFTVYSVPGPTTQHVTIDDDNVFNILFEFDKSHIDIIFAWQYNRMKLLQFSEYNIWDKREKWALYYPKMVKNQLNVTVDAKHTLIVNFNKFINHFDVVIVDILSNIGLHVLDERMENWLLVYKQWREIINVKFFDDVDMIINNILFKRNYDLTQYNISTGDEIVLIRNLIFDHNLSIRGEGIEHMPTNTYNWFNLLEENIYHNIDDYIA